LREALAESRGVDREPPSRRENESKVSFQQRIKQWEKDALAEALLRTRGNQSAAARYLQMPRRTFVRKLGAHGLADGCREATDV